MTENVILEALRVLLFGMLGIFVVMAIIFGVIVLLARISKRFPSDAAVEEESEEFEAAEFEDTGEHYVIEEQYVVGEDYADEYGGSEYGVDEYGDPEYEADVEVVEA